jgi:hypothetical protein
MFADMDLDGFLHISKAGRAFWTHFFFANNGVMVEHSFVCMYQQLKCKHDIIIVEYRNNYLLYLIVKSKTVLL